MKLTQCLTTQIAFATLVCALATGADAQQVIVPPPGPDPQTGCLVERLDPNGDGFLALRAGPGTDYPQIGRAHNGDALFLARECSGHWCYAESGVFAGATIQKKFWFYDAWCQFYP